MQEYSYSFDTAAICYYSLCLIPQKNKIPYFSIDNARVIYTKNGLNS